MAKEKKNNVLMYAIIAVVVVVAIVVGVVVAIKKNGGDSSDGGSGNNTSKLDEYKKVDVVIEYGDYDGMMTLAKGIQNGEMTGKVVKIDGTVSHPLTTYSIVEASGEGGNKIGTQFVIDGDGDYPEDGTRVVITGKVIEASPLYFLIQTLPDLIETK